MLCSCNRGKAQFLGELGFSSIHAHSNGYFFPVSTASEALVEDDFEQCEHTVKKWASSSLESEVSEDKHLLRDLLFFLHVPRTGGRTYFHW